MTDRSIKESNELFITRSYLKRVHADEPVRGRADARNQGDATVITVDEKLGFTASGPAADGRQHELVEDRILARLGQ